MHMRFVRFKVKEGKLWGFAGFYEDRIIPAMQETEGCLFASLLQPSGDDDEFLYEPSEDDNAQFADAWAAYNDGYDDEESNGSYLDEGFNEELAYAPAHHPNLYEQL